MNEKYIELLAMAKTWVEKRFAETWDVAYSYHNLNHTLEVIDHVKKIGIIQGLTTKDQFIAQMAAAFHDLGYLSGHQNHEERSIDLAIKFLSPVLSSDEIIQSICNTIKATEIPQNPKDEASKVLCDADLHYLAAEDFFTRAETLRLEWWSTGRAHLDQITFLEFSLDFLVKHHFHSAYGLSVLKPLKDKNLAKLRKMITKAP